MAIIECCAKNCLPTKDKDGESNKFYCLAYDDCETRKKYGTKKDEMSVEESLQAEKKELLAKLAIAEAELKKRSK